MLQLATCGLAAACLLYALPGGAESRQQRLFALSAAALILWAFGSALSAAARAAWVSRLGLRLAPLGWGTIISLFTHFILSLTRRDTLLKKWWIYPVIYLPAALAVPTHTLLPLLGLRLNLMVRTRYGWADIAPLQPWNLAFYACVLLEVGWCVAELARWGRRSDVRSVRAQAAVLSVSLALSAVMALLADLAPLLLGFPLPSLSAVFLSGLVLAVCFCVGRYRLMQSGQGLREELILSPAQRQSFYFYLGLFVLAGGALVGLLSPYLIGNRRGLPTYVIACLIAVCAVTLLLLGKSRFGDRFKEMALSLCVVLLLPLIDLWSAELGEYTAWAVVFPTLIACLLFNRRILMGSVLAVSVLTQLISWARFPSVQWEFSRAGHLFRLSAFVFGALLSLYVHSVYRNKLRENVNHISAQGIVSELSQRFAAVDGVSLGPALEELLARCGRFMRCDRACFAPLEGTGLPLRRGFLQWTAPGLPPRPAEAQAALARLGPLLADLLRGERLLILRNADLSSVPEALRRELAVLHIRGLAAAPIRSGDALVGLLLFTSDRPVRRWNLGSAEFIEIVAGIAADAVVRTDGERRLRRMAYHDQLTGLANRSLLEQRLTEELRHARASDGMAAVVFLDLDGFKAVNDTLGHDQGDRLLVALARSLTEAAGPGDIAARYGGDEFIFCLSDLRSPAELRDRLEALMDLLQRPVILERQEFFVTVSAGVAVYPQDGEDADTLIKNADLAMYSAKRAGKARYALCSPEMKQELRARRELTGLLYQALPKNQLTLFYQPQVALASGRIVSLEALLRWRLPERGLVPPADFIPLAEQTGLIHAMGAWVLREACAANRRWHDLGCAELRVAVNVSIHQLRSPDFISQVEGTLRDSGLEPRFLELEISEAAATDGSDGMLEALRRLKALGLCLAIDDFGVQYSSLSRLRQLPVDRIKMDMQFVQGIERSVKDQAISKVIINLAKSLQLKVAAEGVETAPQYRFLSRRMCDEAQGFYCHRPMPESEATELLLRERAQDEDCV